MPTENSKETSLPELEQQITKWKFKYNSKNADYILLYQEFEEYKKKHYLPWLLVFILAGITLYFYLNNYG